MKIQWACRVSVLAVLTLVVLQTESRGQMYYGQPYGVPPQMVYGPSGAAFVYGPGAAAPAWPYVVPAAYNDGGPQAMESTGESDPSAESAEAADEGGSEYLFESGSGSHGCGTGVATGAATWPAC